ncbi:hypothetical protein [Pantoea sp. B65]|uniref:hypothetical protein n=1 Tax=Pantoea sp. B65 TaxID=2813359 RepID=UPI0039B56AF3
MNNFVKMADITSFYRRFIITIKNVKVNDSYATDAEKKASLIYWLEEQKKNKNYKLHCKYEILSMIEEVKKCSLAVLEQRIAIFYQNCVVLLDECLQIASC